MRSCTGWPSGIWIDEPRRTAPDGSNFQLQHWTHDFDYALVCGDGDWRQRADPGPQCAVLPPAARRRLGRADGGSGLAPTGSLLHVEPADSVQLGALKAAGNPLAARQRRARRPRRGGAAAGGNDRERHPRRRRLRAGQGARAAARRPAGNAAGKAGRANRRSTCTAIRWPPCWPGSRCPRLAAGACRSWPREAEAAQPLYARYWLHNRGPAPLGGLPAVAHLHPQSATAEPGDEVVLRLTAASDCSDADAARHRRRWCARTAGRPHPPSCRSRWAPASTWRPTSC